MSKAKKCRNCGAICDQYASFCDSCRESLMNVEAEEIADEWTELNIEEELEKKSEDNEVDSEVTLRLPPQPRLECLTQPGFIFEINDGTIIGRDGDVDISSLYNSDYISGKHAAFHFNNGNWYIEDLKSTNGTLVNQVRLREHQKQIIYERDKITLANVTFIFRIRP